jgi:hypothetical protein
MSIDKSILTGKEYRKPYKGSKRFDSTCRNNGSCPYCKGNRLKSNRIRKQIEEDKLKESHFNNNQ